MACIFPRHLIHLSSLNRCEPRELNRWFAQGCSLAQRSTFTSTVFPDAIVHVRGDTPYGSREYILLPPHVALLDADKMKIATLRAHRNILFAAKSNNVNYDTPDICIRLVDAALEDAAAQGEQPQAIAGLHGLCDWIRDSLAGTIDNQLLDEIKESDPISFEAVQAIATGQPRPGHSVVGEGTYRDGQEAWKQLAREYVKQGMAPECILYKKRGAELVDIEHLADTKPDYMKAAGGAMARLFFL